VIVKARLGSGERVSRQSLLRAFVTYPVIDALAADVGQLTRKPLGSLGEDWSLPYVSAGGGPERRMILVSVSATPSLSRRVRSRLSSSAVSWHATRSW
jgi:hypothetical protein